MKRRARTLADLAEIAGVTPATVSRALTGNPRISEATRERVQQIADQNGFFVNQTARNLRTGRTRSIACVIPLGHQSAQRVSDPFYTTLIGQLMDGLSAREHDMLLSAVAPSDSAWLTSLAGSGRVDGVIVLCQSDQNAVLREVGRSYRPLVVWGEEAPAGGDYCCIGTDNRAGGRLATEHLLAQGRRAIAFAGMTDIPELFARHQGYLDAHAAAGVEPGPLIPIPLAYDGTFGLFHEGLNKSPALDGIVAASDVIAMGALRALSDADRKVPDDVAVVGYDDVGLAEHTLPPLTTIRQDLHAAADAMLHRLFARMDGAEAPSTRIPLQLVCRDSA